MSDNKQNIEDRFAGLQGSFNYLKDNLTSRMSGVDYKVEEISNFLNKNIAYMQHRLDKLEHPNLEVK